MVSPSQLQVVLLRCHLPGASREAQEELLPLWTTPVAQLLQWNFTKAGDPDQVLMTAVGKGGKALQHGQLKLSNWLENAQGLVSTAFPSPASNGDSDCSHSHGSSCTVAEEERTLAGHMPNFVAKFINIHQIVVQEWSQIIEESSSSLTTIDGLCEFLLGGNVANHYRPPIGKPTESEQGTSFVFPSIFPCPPQLHNNGYQRLL